MKSKLFLFLICIGIFPMIMSGYESPRFNKVTTFKKDGKWGARINDETMLLPAYESLRWKEHKLSPGDFVFIYTENGKEGILGRYHMATLPLYDKIEKILYSPSAFIYENAGERGIRKFDYAYTYVNPSTKEIIKATDRDLDIIIPGQYKNFVVNGDIREETDAYAICQTHDNKLRIINLRDGKDYTPYFDIKKLGGNIKDVIKGKIPLKDLEINMKQHDVWNQFTKIKEKHKEYQIETAPEGFRSLGILPFYEEEEILEHTKDGRFEGVITVDGYVSIPLQYNHPDEILERDPENFPAIVHKIYIDKDNNRVKNPSQTGESYPVYYTKVADYNYSYVPVWEAVKELALARKNEKYVKIADSEIKACKEQAQKAANKANSYKRRDAIFSSISSFVSQISNMVGQNNGSSSSYQNDAEMAKTSSSSSKGKSNGNKYALNQQVNFNRDKKTYAQYDSQLAAYFAGNRPMTISEKEEAQRKMRELREKWEKQGKNIPKSQNEDR